MRLMIGLRATTMELIIIANDRNMKYTILTLSLLFSFSLDAQHIMLGSGDGPPTAPALNLLLDDYPGAAAAFSLRELTTSWAGKAVVRVRESGGNTQQDFTAAEVTDGTLATFCGSNDGFVVTWYDQSGNGSDATQSTAADQGLIVASGTLNTQDGLPAIDFNDDYYSISPSLTTTSGISSVFAVVENDNSSTFRTIVRGSNVGSMQVRLSNNNTTLQFLRAGQSLIQQLTGVPTSTNMIVTSIADAAGVFLRANTVDIQGTKAPSINVQDIAYLSNFSSPEALVGNMQEVIIYTSDQSANRASIETDINSHYTIY